MQCGMLPHTGMRQFPYDIDYSDGVGNRGAAPVEDGVSDCVER